MMSATGVNTHGAVDLAVGNLQAGFSDGPYLEQAARDIPNNTVKYC
jgi:hypothetical protein